MHGTVNPNYKIRGTKRNEIGKEWGGLWCIYIYVSESGKAKCLDIYKVEDGIEFFHTFLYS